MLPIPGPGRPSSFTEEIAAEICQRVAHGETIKQITADAHMPDQTTINRWAEKNEAFRLSYARAREQQLERWEDEILEIADDGSNDWIERESKSGRIETVPDHDHINRSKLRVDARKWIMSKRLPRKYGDRLGIEGTDGLPLQVVVKRFTDEQLEAAETDRLIEHQGVLEAKPLKSLEPVRFIDGERVESAPQHEDKPDRSTE